MMGKERAVMLEKERKYGSPCIKAGRRWFPLLTKTPSLIHHRPTFTRLYSGRPMQLKMDNVG
jgi:hypothetical protein